MTHVHASAIVDPLPIHGIGGTWRVTVWGDRADSGKPPPVTPETAPHARVYHIAAKSDDLAAHEGIARFVAELSA